MKICMNANIIKTQFFHKIIYALKCNFYFWRNLVNFFTLKPSDLITTLTYVFIVFLNFIFLKCNKICLHIPRIHIKIRTQWQNTFFDLTGIGMCRGENVFSALGAIIPKGHRYSF